MGSIVDRGVSIGAVAEHDVHVSFYAGKGSRSGIMELPIESISYFAIE